MYNKKNDQRRILYVITVVLSLVLVTTLIVATMVGCGKIKIGNSDKNTETTGTTQVEGVETTEPSGDASTDPTATTPTGTASTDPAATDPAGTDPANENASGDDPEGPGPTGGAEPDDPVDQAPGPQVTEPTEPPEPTVGVDTETTPPQPDNVIDFDDLLDAANKG